MQSRVQLLLVLDITRDKDNPDHRPSSSVYVEKFAYKISGLSCYLTNIHSRHIGLYEATSR